MRRSNAHETTLPAADRIADAIEPVFRSSAALAAAETTGFRLSGRRVHVLAEGTVTTPSGGPAKLVALVDLGPGLVRAAREGAPATATLDLGRALLDEIPAGSLVLATGTLANLDLCCALRTRACDFVVRAPRPARYRVVLEHSAGDAIVDVPLPSGAPAQRLRMIDAGEGEVLLGTILDPAYTKEELRALDRERAEGEELARGLDGRIRACFGDDLSAAIGPLGHGSRHREVFALLTAFNALRRIAIGTEGGDDPPTSQAARRPLRLDRRARAA